MESLQLAQFRARAGRFGMDNQGFRRQIEELKVRLSSETLRRQEAELDRNYWRSKWERDFTARTALTRIVQAVSSHTGIMQNDIVSERRNKDFVYARHIAMALARKFTSKSFPQIARFFGDRDHTTVVHAVQKMDRLIQSDQQVAADIYAISKVLIIGAENVA